MNWRHFFGEETYNRLVKYCMANNQRVSAVIRMAVIKFLDI